MITIRLKLFASIKDICGFSEKEIIYDSPVTVSLLVNELSEEYPGLQAKKDSLLIAVNEDYAGLDTKLTDGDTVAIFPPVSGG